MKIALRLLIDAAARMTKLGAGIIAPLFASIALLISTPSFPAPVAYPLSFAPGWNLAGNSLGVSVDVKETFSAQSNIKSVWKWDRAAASWAFYAPTLDAAGSLAAYSVSNGYRVLATIGPGEGYWVNAAAAVSLGVQSGTGLSLATANLVTGWNLAATADYVTAGGLKASVGNITTLWAWDNADSAWYFYAPTLEANGTLASYIQSKGYKDFGTLTLGQGRGFWVNYPGASTQASLLAAAADAFMSPYLTSNGITASTLTIMKNGVVLYEKAYGYQNLAGTIPLSADALMTGASIVKPVTAAAIQKLASAGTLSLADKVFCAAGLTPSAASHCWISSTWVTSNDARIQSITIAHLLAHKGGWDRSRTTCFAYQISDTPTRTLLTNNGDPCDPIQHEAIVQAAGGISAPPTLEQDIRLFMNGNLDFAPGATASYSNFGYMLLGLIVERASGAGYNAYVSANILSPLGVSGNDFKTNSSLLVNADPREPNYITTLTAPSVYAPGTFVSARDGALNTANFPAAATTAMTSRAMATFAGIFKIDTDANGVDGVNNGKLLDGTTNDAFHRGDLPGTAALVRQMTSGVSYSVLMNKNDQYEGGGSRKDYPSDVRAGIDAAIAAAGY